MTTIAGGGEQSGVEGRLAVASGARFRGAPERVPVVAGAAWQRSMGASQRKGREVVVECPIRPRRWTVASLALGPELSGVDVIPSVTAVAIARNPGPLPIHVAICAVDLGVAGLQLEGG